MPPFIWSQPCINFTTSYNFVQKPDHLIISLPIGQRSTKSIHGLCILRKTLHYTGNHGVDHVKVEGHESRYEA